MLLPTFLPTLYHHSDNIITTVVNLIIGKRIVSAHIRQHLNPFHVVYSDEDSERKNGYGCVRSKDPPQFYAPNNMLELW